MPAVSSFRFLWITDPWDTLDHARDTTLRLAEEAIALGAESWWCDARSIRWERDRVLADARRIRRVRPGRAPGAFDLAPAKAMEPAEFDSLHYRTDPPVDLAYLHPVQLLLLGLPDRSRSKPLKGRRRAELVNPASSLCQGNEKLEAVFPGLLPPTVASSQWAPLEAFGRREGRTVLKPLHQAQSKGIELLDWRTPRGVRKARASIRAATQEHARPILLQRYLAGISEGEKRLWFVDGKLLATIRKLPLPNDFRVDMDRGSLLKPVGLDASEKRVAARIGKHLVHRRIRLAAVDLIDGQLTDFNFTSPGLLVPMETVLGENLARPVVQALLAPFAE